MKIKERLVEEIVHKDGSVDGSKGARSTRSTRSRKSRYSHYSISSHSEEGSTGSVDNDRSVDASRGTRNSKYSHRSSKSKQSGSHHGSVGDERSVDGSRVSRKSRYSHRSEGPSNEVDEVKIVDDDRGKHGRKPKKSSESSTTSSQQSEEDQRDEISQVQQSESESADGSDNHERRISDGSHAANNDEEDGTFEVGDIIGSLETVLGSVKNLDALDVLKEMQGWKERALNAEQKNWAMSEEIKALEKDVSMWQGRTRRIELRCERIKKGQKEEAKQKRNRPPFSFSNDDRSRNSDDDETAIPHEPSAQLQTFLRGNSFRGKWDRKRISGIEEETDLSTVGESTVQARKYVQDYIQSHPLLPAESSEERDDVPRHIVSKRSLRNTQNNDEEPQWMEI
jgi:hypothetical protein